MLGVHFQDVTDVDGRWGLITIQLPQILDKVVPRLRCPFKCSSGQRQCVVAQDGEVHILMDLRIPHKPEGSDYHAHHSLLYDVKPLDL